MGSSMRTAALPLLLVLALSVLLMSQACKRAEAPSETYPLHFSPDDESVYLLIGEGQAPVSFDEARSDKRALSAFRALSRGVLRANMNGTIKAIGLYDAEKGSLKLKGWYIPVPFVYEFHPDGGVSYEYRVKDALDGADFAGEVPDPSLYSRLLNDTSEARIRKGVRYPYYHIMNPGPAEHLRIDGQDVWFIFDPELSDPEALGAFKALKWNVLYANREGGIELFGDYDTLYHRFALRHWYLPAPFKARLVTGHDIRDADITSVSKPALDSDDFNGSVSDPARYNRPLQ